MSETHNTTVYDPALWAEAVAWQQECGVFDLLAEQPIDAFAAREQAKAVTEPAIRSELTQQSPHPTAPNTALNAPPKPPKQPLQKPAARPAANQHERRGLEAVADIAEAEKLAAACMTVEDLHQAVKDFEGCLLKETASTTVFGDGPIDSDIMIIGEAPGADEDRQGKPFVGRSGQMLDTMLSYIGLNREEHFRITNIVFWRPPGNRKPNAGEVALCWPFSRRHIELVQPKVILAVGGLSAQTLIDPNLRITRERGKWRSLAVEGTDVPILPTLHPAYLLRQPVNKRQAWTDLLLLNQFLEKQRDAE